MLVINAKGEKVRQRKGLRLWIGGRQITLVGRVARESFSEKVRE